MRANNLYGKNSSVSIELHCPRGDQIAPWEWEEFRNALAALGAKDISKKEIVPIDPKEKLRTKQKKKFREESPKYTIEDIIDNPKLHEFKHGTDTVRKDAPSSSQSSHERTSPYDVIYFTIDKQTPGLLIDIIDTHLNDFFYKHHSLSISNEKHNVSQKDNTPKPHYLSKCCVIARLPNVVGGITDNRASIRSMLAQEVRENVKWSVIKAASTQRPYAAFSFENLKTPAGLEQKTPDDIKRYYKNAMQLAAVINIDRNGSPKVNPSTGERDDDSNTHMLVDYHDFNRMVRINMIPEDIVTQVQDSYEALSHAKREEIRRKRNNQKGKGRGEE